jgi:mono/diheme cytochrome c family protein
MTPAMKHWLFVLLVACDKGGSPPPPTSGAPNAQLETGPKRMFETVCATCHGIDGSGNGPAAEALNPKPRNYRDPAWQSSVTDDVIRQTILKGGQGMGKSPMMPAQPQLKDQPEVLEGLVQIIRRFGRHP